MLYGSTANLFREFGRDRILANLLYLGVRAWIDLLRRTVIEAPHVTVLFRPVHFVSLLFQFFILFAKRHPAHY